MNQLEKIVTEKKKQVADEKQLYPRQLLERSIYYHSRCVSLKKYLLREDKNGIIAEIKKSSPALGAINPYVNVEKLSIAYMQAGASALSVLTDKTFFGGSNADLSTARKFNFCPILRKEFIIDDYQVIEAKSIGADAILLIAAILTKEQIMQFSTRAQQLGMEIILEIHAEEELDKLTDAIDIVGVNNRNLQTMEIDLSTSRKLAHMIPEKFTRISESGIESPEIVNELRALGYKGFLIGSSFMKHPEPGKACSDFINQLNKGEKEIHAA